MQGLSILHHKSLTVEYQNYKLVILVWLRLFACEVKFCSIHLSSALKIAAEIYFIHFV